MPRFSTHTTRHLCLTDLARMGWELHAIATFAGHRSTESTLRYIHLSGRDLADKLEPGMARSTRWRVGQLAASRSWGRQPAVTAALAASGVAGVAPAFEFGLAVHALRPTR